MIPFHHHYKSDPVANANAFDNAIEASRGQFPKVWKDHWYWRKDE